MRSRDARWRSFPLKRRRRHEQCGTGSQPIRRRRRPLRGRGRVENPSHIPPGGGMIRFANPWWLLLAIAVAARVALLVRDRRRRFGAFVVSSMALVAPKKPLRTRVAWLPFAL